MCHTMFEALRIHQIKSWHSQDSHFCEGVEKIGNKTK